MASDSGALGFVRAGWTNPQAMLPRSELQPVVYRVRDHVLQRLYYPFVDATNAEPAIQDLLTEVESFEVMFSLAANQPEGKTSGWLQQNELPTRVYIRIEHKHFGVIERVLLTSGGMPKVTENTP